MRSMHGSARRGCRVSNVECGIAKLFAGSGFVTQGGYYIMYDPLMFNLMDKVGQAGSGPADMLAQSRNGTRGYFERLYEMEENAEVRAMFEGWVRRFRD
jgi:hypothetical protein